MLRLLSLRGGREMPRLRCVSENQTLNSRLFELYKGCCVPGGIDFDGAGSNIEFPGFLFAAVRRLAGCILPFFVDAAGEGPRDLGMGRDKQWHMAVE